MPHPSQRFVYLPALGRKVPLGAYVAAVAKAKANPDATFKSSLERWEPSQGNVVVAEFRKGVHDRINKHLPGYGQGRKWGSIWQVETWRASRALNTPRLAIHWLPSHLKARFAERLS